MKRFIAILLTVAMLITGLFSLAGCNATTADTALSMGQWVTLIAESFGMQNYLSDEPHFKNVTKESNYFSAFQMAAEWDILEPTDEIRDTTAVKYSDVLITLVNAGGFMPDGSSDEEKINYAIDNFDSSIRKYWMNRYIKLNKAVELLDKAQKLWAERPFTDTVNEAKFAGDVKNYLQEDLQYTEENGIIKIDADKIDALKAGDVFTLPCNGASAAMIKKVGNVTYDNGCAYIECEELSDEELETYAENVVVRDSTEIDFSNIVGIYDENGNPIIFDDIAEQSSDINSDIVGSSATVDMNPQFVHLGMSPKDKAQIVNTSIFDNAKGEYTFTVKGNKIYRYIQCYRSKRK